MGHNELDQPSFTQPLMYKKIAKHPKVEDIYMKQTLQDGVFSESEVKALEKTIDDTFEEAYVKSKDLSFQQEEWQTPEWTAIKKNPMPNSRSMTTGYETGKLKEIGLAITTLPKEGTWHRQIQKIFDTRVQSINEGVGIDWGTAEALAFASLIDQGYHVRISGQDVERGTFSHRHAIVHDQNTDANYVPIDAICPTDGYRNFIASNSHLSEFAVLGYEYGYSLANPNTLTIWEAQFGDFSNEA